MKQEIMSAENRNSANEDKSSHREQAGAAFCEELLNCCVCGKIYFSRRPIALSMLSQRKFHVCLACSRTLTCSTCGRRVPAEIALVYENLPNSTLGFLCPRCREKMFVGFRTPPQSVPRRLWSRVTARLTAFLNLFRRVMRIEIWPNRRRR